MSFFVLTPVHDYSPFLNTQYQRSPKRQAEEETDDSYFFGDDDEEEDSDQKGLVSYSDEENENDANKKDKDNLQVTLHASRSSHHQ